MSKSLTAISAVTELAKETEQLKENNALVKAALTASQRDAMDMRVSLENAHRHINHLHSVMYRPMCCPLTDSRAEYDRDMGILRVDVRMTGRSYVFAHPDITKMVNDPMFLEYSTKNIRQEMTAMLADNIREQVDAEIRRNLRFIHERECR